MKNCFLKGKLAVNTFIKKKFVGNKVFNLNQR